MRITLLLAIIFFASCSSFNEHVVDYDYNYNGKFDKYHSFGFMDDFTTDAGDFHQEIIIKSIGDRMRAQGYRHTQDKPNLLISYKIYYGDLVLRGYSQPSLNSWIAGQYSQNFLAPPSPDSLFAVPVTNETDFPVIEDEEDDKKERKYKKYYDPIACEMREGSIYISFYDRKRQQAIWSGYASGFVGNKNFDNERFIRSMVGKILDKYRVLSQSYVSSMQ